MDPTRPRLGEALEDDATTALHAVTVTSRAVPVAVRTAMPVPRELRSALLPGETVTLGSRPHPIVLVRPLVLIALVLAVFAVVARTQPHVVAYAEAFGAAALAAAVWTLVRNTAYFLGFRAVATNRRVFVIRGIVRRRVAPLGNTALASSTLLQGVLGRMYGFGSVEVPQEAPRRALFHDMRDAGALYRECQAVAHGVDGDQWTPAVRQTIVP